MVTEAWGLPRLRAGYGGRALWLWPLSPSLCPLSWPPRVCPRMSSFGATRGTLKYYNERFKKRGAGRVNDIFLLTVHFLQFRFAK